LVDFLDGKLVCKAHSTPHGRAYASERKSEQQTNVVPPSDLETRDSTNSDELKPITDNGNKLRPTTGSHTAITSSLGQVCDLVAQDLAAMPWSDSGDPDQASPPETIRSFSVFAVCAANHDRNTTG
jgi:hypothetical protein